MTTISSAVESFFLSRVKVGTGDEAVSVAEATMLATTDMVLKTPGGRA